MDTTEIAVRDTLVNKERYYNLHDLAQMVNSEEPEFLVTNWLSIKNTIEFIASIERKINSEFNESGFEPIWKNVGLSSFIVTPQQWCDQTNSKSLIIKNKHPYANKYLTMKFASWLSVDFELFMFQLLESQSTNLLEDSKNAESYLLSKIL